ncbi:MAG: c-type cytochrome [Gemmatimonadaceae bacterium]
MLAVASLAAVAACRPGGVKRPAQVTRVNVSLGDSLFNNGNCQRCHGKGGIGAANAPTLDGKKWLQLKTGSYRDRQDRHRGCAAGRHQGRLAPLRHAPPRRQHEPHGSAGAGGGRLRLDPDPQVGRDLQRASVVRGVRC